MRLSILANAARKRMPDLTDEWADEVGRAHVLAAGELPRNVACMTARWKSAMKQRTRSKKVTLLVRSPDNNKG